MPIDSNIALGVRPIEQPNMLGQMGQFMALRAAQQETEGYEGVKNALAGGMDAADPRLLQYGKRGIEAFKAAGEGKIKQLEAGKRQSEMLGNIFGGVMQDPSSGPAAVSQLLKMGVIKPEEAQQVMAQAGNDPEAWKKIAAPYYQQSIDSTKRFQDETERWKANLQAQVTREGHGVQIRGQNMTAGTAEKALEFQKQKRNVIAGEGQFLNTDAYGNVYPVAQYGEVNGPNAPASPLPPAAAGNFLATQVAPQQPATNVNALTQQPVNQPGAPTVANAAVMNAPRPSAGAGYKYNEQGQKVKVEQPVWNEKAQVYMTPPTAENPEGTVTPVPAVQKAVQERTANATLKVAGYNPKTGSDEVSDLIKKSTSGLGENWANKAWSAVTGTGSAGAEAIGKLEARANEMTLALAPNGSLGAGFSNEDRTFMLGKLGDVANPNKPMNVRLAAWEDVMERTARTAGVPYTKQSSYTSSAPKSASAPNAALPKGFKLD